ncbi:MAG: hypothetical protein CJBNEKGG_04519 [Prosthecobacter sp.]|nr:hypothetical protein [Prosthecobacter sp.]
MLQAMQPALCSGLCQGSTPVGMLRPSAKSTTLSALPSPSVSSRILMASRLPLTCVPCGSDQRSFAAE